MISITRDVSETHPFELKYPPHDRKDAATAPGTPENWSSTEFVMKLPKMILGLTSENPKCPHTTNNGQGQGY